MKLTTFKQHFLQSGNQRQDKRVAFLIEQVGGNIDRFLGQKGDIDCKKIDDFLRQNPEKFSPEILAHLQRTLIKVRSVHMHQSTISAKLDGCHSLEERLEVLRGYTKSLQLNSFILIRLLGGIDSLDKAKRVINKYGNGVEITYEVINILFKLSTSLSEKKDLLAEFWSGKPCDIYMLNMMLSHAINVEEYWDIISQYGQGLGEKSNIVTLLMFLKVCLKDTNQKSKNDAIAEALQIIQELPGQLNEKDQRHMGILLNGSHGYRGFMLHKIRENKLTKFYFLLPEERSQ